MRPAISVRCICNLYVDKGRIARHIVPLLGTKRVRDLTSADINRFKRDVANGKTAVTEKKSKKSGGDRSSKAARARRHELQDYSAAF